MEPVAGFKLVDCDGHVLEPIDIWDRYAPAEYRERANQACYVVNRPGGGATLRLNGGLHPSHGRMQSAGTFGIAPEEAVTRQWTPEQLCKGGFDPRARVADQMNPSNIEAAMLFGSVGNQLNGVRDAEILAVMCRAYNRWLLEEYCQPYSGRLFPIALLPWLDTARALQELRWAAENGFRGVKLPAKRLLPDKPLHHKDLLPMWAMAEEAGIVVAIHPSSVDQMPDMSEVLVRDEGSPPNGAAIVSPMNGMVSLTQFIYSGVLDAYPRLKVCILECNGGWMPQLLDRLDGRYCFAPQDFPQMKSLPSETFRRQCAIAFMAEEKTTLPLFAEAFQDHILWGSDYPHLDAETAGEMWETLSSVPEPIQRKILRDNAIKLYGLPLA